MLTTGTWDKIPCLLNRRHNGAGCARIHYKMFLLFWFVAQCPVHKVVEVGGKSGQGFRLAEENIHGLDLVESISSFVLKVKVICEKMKTIKTCLFISANGAEKRFESSAMLQEVVLQFVQFEGVEFLNFLCSCGWLACFIALQCMRNTRHQCCAICRTVHELCWSF